MSDWHLKTPAYRGPQTAIQHLNSDPWEYLYGETRESLHRLAVVSVFWGTKYSTEYVRKLRMAVEQHIGVPHEFFCITDNEKIIAAQHDWRLTVLAPPTMHEGWWQKVGLFAPNLIPTCSYKPETLIGAPLGMFHCPECGDMQLAGAPHSSRYVLYLDLDVVVRSGLVNILRSGVPPQGLVMAENFGPNKPHCAHNSSVMLWRAGECTELYTDFKKVVCSTLHGDQCWIWRRLDGRIREFPAEYVRSYKYDCRQAGLPPAGAAVIVFHGEPNPHQCGEPWVRREWHAL